MAAQVAQSCALEPLTLIGFSLGAPAALAVARDLGKRVAQVHLVSPAAPLALGDFLDDMAGGTLFRMAQSRPRLFRMAVHLQSLLAQTAPNFLLDRLFATAAGKDRALFREPAFRQAMAQVLREGLGRDPRGFIADVAAYVADGGADLAHVGAPVTIWQGTQDNWTPPAMARALAGALPGPVTLHLLPGCSHYSALRAALARL
ncbi:alpha/beta fold hydrolase [Sandarakinorhabdus rubra]|uniref:alpha/beta fold hydrolase n=1 Tax=Sandarakinorhabdus rubra TaxID=2672568 RepID=UPI0013DB8910|nr:alpha/beta hydrolase [Sandarakinorhabdus rubra]